MQTETIIKALGTITAFALLIALGAMLGAYPLKWTVNYLINPRWLLEAFGTPQIGFWQAFCLNYIAASLIKGTPASK
jgi:hypothetical protein